MEQSMIDALEIKESKKVDPKGYTTLELMYLASVALEELEVRKKDLKNAFRSVEAEINRLQHIIELQEHTEAEKKDIYNQLFDTLTARRKIKQEQVINNRATGKVHARELGVTLKSLMSITLSGKRTNDGKKINQLKPDFKQGELKKLLKKYK